MRQGLLQKIMNKIHDDVNFTNFPMANSLKGGTQMKHVVTLTVADSDRQKTVLRGTCRRLPEKLIRLLFGDFRLVYMLDPGRSVMSVDVKEEK